MQPSNLPSARATPATNSGNTPSDSLCSPTPADRPRSPLGVDQDRPMCYFPKANLHHSPNRPNEVGIPIEFLLSIFARLRSRQARRKPHRPTSPRVVVCVSCREAKKRCIGERPCNRCVRRNIADTCVDAPSLKTNGAVTRQSTAAPSNADPGLAQDSFHSVPSAYPASHEATQFDRSTYVHNDPHSTQALPHVPAGGAEFQPQAPGTEYSAHGAVQSNTVTHEAASLPYNGHYSIPSGIATFTQFGQSPYAHGAVDPRGTQALPPFYAGGTEFQPVVSDMGYGACPSAVMPYPYYDSATPQGAIENPSSYCHGYTDYYGAAGPSTGTW